MGIAGIGKSRLAWEFYKYFDGLVDNVYWHRGRCLAYGEGVTYWALADMVRMRCRHLRGRGRHDGACQARRDSRPSTCSTRTSERSWSRSSRACSVSPRSSPHTSVTTCSPPGGSSSSGSPNTYPTVLVFEDMQWADASLLDFVEYLLEWSKSSPLFVLVLTRPELLDKRPNWGAGHRNFTSLHLGPLSEAAMDGAPRRLRTRPARVAVRADPRARRRRAALRGRDDPDAARPRTARFRKDRSTDRRARSHRSKYPKRCTGSWPRVSTGCLRRSAACSRTRPFSARRSRVRDSRR